MKPIWKGKIMGHRVSVYERVVLSMLPEDDGICRKWGRGFVISVRPGLKPKRQLEVMLHELLHAADWHKDEEWVEQVAWDLAQVLWSLGWRPADFHQPDG